jgi:hypothetical protein
VLAAQTPGNFRFIAAPARPFSGGAVADPGFGLVHAVFSRPRPLVAGLAAACGHVEAAGRPVAAICGFELRIPSPLSADAFEEFNRDYVSRLRSLGVVAGELLPAARTNVAPTVRDGVGEPCVYAVTYTVPGAGPGWLLSGAPEREPGTVSEMLAGIMDVLAGRLDELGGEWVDATGVNLYGDREEAAVVLPLMANASPHGVRWYPSLPPIQSLRLEVDARCAATELVLPPS